MRGQLIDFNRALKNAVMEAKVFHEMRDVGVMGYSNQCQVVSSKLRVE